MIDGGILRAALAEIGAVGKQIASWEDLAVGANESLLTAPGLTVEGAAAFLATCAQESAYFRTTTEYGSKWLRYDPYRGRTFTQITWRENYLDFGRWAHRRGLVQDPEVFVRDPKALGSLRWAWLGPIQYWEENNIWHWANRGNFRATSQAINGGAGRVGTSFTPHGWDERLAMYRVFLRYGPRLIPAAPPQKGREEVIIDREIPHSPAGASGRIICPVGSASELVKRAWLSASFDGGANLEVWFQDSRAGSDAGAPGTRPGVNWPIQNAERPWIEIPSGTEFVQYRCTRMEGPGVLCVELENK